MNQNIKNTAELNETELNAVAGGCPVIPIKCGTKLPIGGCFPPKPSIKLLARLASPSILSK